MAALDTGRRNLVVGAATILAMRGSWGQGRWPERPIKLIVPFPAGGINDLLGRIVGQQLAAALNASVIVDNRPGAGGLIGTRLAAKADPDGYTLFLGNTTTMSVVPQLHRAPGFVPQTDFTPAGGVASVPSVLVTAGPYPTLRRFIDAARNQPGKLSYGSAGLGASQHVQQLMLNDALNISMLHVPFKGGAPAMQEVLAGRVDAMLEPIATVLPHVKSGRLKALAVTSAARSELLPDVPTFAEEGVKDFVLTLWFGIFLPAKAPPEIVRTIERALLQVQRDPLTAKAFLQLGASPLELGQEALARFAAEDAERWKKVLAGSNLEVQ